MMSYYLEINTGSFYHLAAETFRELNIEMSYQNKSKESACKKIIRATRSVGDPK